MSAKLHPTLLAFALVCAALSAACGGSKEGGDSPEQVARRFVDAVEREDLEGIANLYPPAERAEVAATLQRTPRGDLKKATAHLRKAVDAGAVVFQDAGVDKLPVDAGDAMQTMRYACDRGQCNGSVVRIDGRWYMKDPD